MDHDPLHGADIQAGADHAGGVADRTTENRPYEPEVCAALMLDSITRLVASAVPADGASFGGENAPSHADRDASGRRGTAGRSEDCRR
jgi:hypothetical protein